ncbi:hypothetical protein OEM_36900 [Mycobacterium intracellulare subsp. yongonense 05-1390]|nr:hypothetical protein OEM_36900 [Mycobacterium intracellulare subsp. yongonense 05-1390]ARR79289.1 hypothetical protein MOTT12_03625 [Mycobacterium intracellulare subsp. yongonense]ARR84360.1 hypothetical protein MOTT27_03539 [Mycobacterium intracellulare subsp. yongonense]
MTSATARIPPFLGSDLQDTFRRGIIDPFRLAGRGVARSEPSGTRAAAGYSTPWSARQGCCCPTTSR